MSVVSDILMATEVDKFAVSSVIVVFKLSSRWH